MTAETRNSNIISPENKDARAKNAENQLTFNRDGVEGIKTLSLEDKMKSEDMENHINALLKGWTWNLGPINEIIRSPDAKRLLSSQKLREIFGQLRAIHRVEEERHINSGNMIWMRDGIAGTLVEINRGYDELFQNIQWHIESPKTPPEDRETLRGFSNEVATAKKSVETLMDNINAIGNAPPKTQSDSSIDTPLKI